MSKNNIKTLVFVCLILTVALIATVLFASCNKDDSTLQVTVYSTKQNFISPSSLSQDVAGKIYVSDSTANKIYKLDGNTVVKSYDFNNETVNKVYVNENDVYVLTGGLQGKVYLMDTDLAVKAEREVGHTPKDALVVNDKLYVANRFSNTLTVCDKGLTTTPLTYDVCREPFALAYTQGKLFVAGHLNGLAATEDVASALVTVFDVAQEKTVKTMKLLNGTGNVNGIAVSSDGSKVYLSNTFARYNYPTTQLDRGWVNTNGITVIDAENLSVLAGVLLDGVEDGAGNPWGIKVTDSGNNARIVCVLSGVGKIAVVNEKQMLDKIKDVKDGKAEYTLSEIVDRVEFSASFTKKIFVGGNGMREVLVKAESGKRYAYVTEYFDGDLVKVSLDADTDTLKYSMENISLGTQAKMTQERLGESIWCNASLSYQGWESCSSCHPEGRSDGLNWDEAGDGLGTPKSTKSLVYSHRTPPVLATGVLDYAETNVAETMQYAFHNDLAEGKLDETYYECMDAYLKSLKPVESPYLNRDGSLTEAAQRGKTIFEQNCASCHSAPLYTDMKSYTMQGSLDVDNSWEDRPMDTPTLVEVWRSQPYLFGGVTTDIKEAIRILFNGKEMSEQDLSDLAAYVLSIGDSGEYYGVEQVFVEDYETDEFVKNELKAGYIVNQVTVRKQNDTAKNAVVEMALYDKNGTLVQNTACSVALPDMETGDYAVIYCKIEVPKDFEKGGYLLVKIKSDDKQAEKLASDLKIYLK